MSTNKGQRRFGSRPIKPKVVRREGLDAWLMTGDECRQVQVEARRAFLERDDARAKMSGDD